ncbi:hypothetical protein [Paenibacillus whitsoniae]|uniref:Uncharacterized protein n=1 Tax=Paenibacillus whitsoniae TaxID=2496558 RepID=A0A3S0BJ58_9BACL|nr:hypothetical protein [Paenibacillus whitsoniae]RTE07705.1 hypothetical protein EJQ19_20710 [Paenibacillus whitsoniae]
MKEQDAFFNWLQMHIVAEARPDDGAAKETLDFFEMILTEDHRVSGLDVEIAEERDLVVIRYVQQGEAKSVQFDLESAAKLLEDIRSNPVYNNQ